MKRDAVIGLQVTVYLGKRDFVDHLDHVDPVGESKHLDVCSLIFNREV